MTTQPIVSRYTDGDTRPTEFELVQGFIHLLLAFRSLRWGLMPVAGQSIAKVWLDSFSVRVFSIYFTIVELTPCYLRVLNL